MWHLSFILHHNAHIYIISEESSQKLISGVKHIFIRSGNCWVGRFCWKPRWFLKRPGVIPDAKGEEDTVFPPFGKDQDEDMNHEYFTHHELYEPELAIVPGWGSISMYPSRYVLYMCIYLALSLSLSLYIYNGFLPHFPFTACTCSYFCNKHTVDEVYCNEIHLICKDTSTYAKESRGQKFSPQQEPLVWKWIQKKGLYSAVLNPANSPSPSDLGRVDPFGGVVPPGPMAVA